MQEARRLLVAEGLAEVVWVERPQDHPRFADACAHILARRSHKGIDAAAARKLAADPLMFAACLVALGEAQGSVAGACHPTAEVIRAGLYCVGTAPGIAVVSSMFLMVRDGSCLSYADCGVIPDPDPAQLAAIAQSTAANHQLLTGEAPRVAFLSFSTKGSAEHPRIDKVREGLRLFQAAAPETLSDGELQLDAALVPEVAAQKAPDSPLQGRANVLIFPDLDAGNLCYKASQRLGGYDAYGPLIQGLAHPCLDLSRGCSAQDIVEVAVIASVMAGD